LKKRRVKNKSDFRKFIIVFFTIIFLGGVGLVYELYSRVYQPNIVFAKDINEKYIYIPTDSDFQKVVTILSENGVLINTNSFQWLAKQKKYDTNIKPGKYKLDRDLNNNELINLLRSGKQAPVDVTFNNLRTKEELAGKVSVQIEADSASIIEYISDVLFQQRLGLNDDNVGCIFLPNTYEFYWNTSAEEFVNRMLKEFSVFWNSKRKKKADDIKLNYYEVSILASIVEKEQNIRLDERPEIAGLYLNRLKKNMKLQSDPTVIFAIGDFSIRRVLKKDLKVNSAYNTYLNKGLPPGPICLPSIDAIDAVLNASKNDYIFMCAKEDFSGYHNFAKNSREHSRNAKKYRRALNKRNIMR
tara:strand:- start:101 stop:1171 length:1071 start_codon:yes stop_codon:yes gene_type:complete